MRDRLIELIQNAVGGCAEYWAKTIADHLIANGVIVPPCKVGDTLYYLDRYSKSVETDTVKFFTITKNGCKPILTRHNIKFWEMYEWGKTVFLTREDAERALEEKSNAD